MRRSHGVPSQSLAWMTDALAAHWNRRSAKSSVANSGEPRWMTLPLPALSPALAFGDLLEAGPGDAWPVAFGRIQHASKRRLAAFQNCFKVVSAPRASRDRPFWRTLL